MQSPFEPAAILSWLLRSGGNKPLMRIPEIHRHPGEIYTGRSHTMKKNLRKVKKSQRRAAYFKAMRGRRHS